MKKVWLVIFCIVSGCDENMSEDSASISGKSSMDSLTTLQSVIISDIDTYKRERGIFSLWDHINTEYVTTPYIRSKSVTSTRKSPSPIFEKCYSADYPRRSG
ncbi:hypothetical protein [Yokenella regensburgei]|uniref:hypothetical protein n=1 Tax=Yokenella regensburgei TaxID=158877 RepID=UPI0011BDC49D|nr:hypothetical protein [Yokenella regensburgei]